MKCRAPMGATVVVSVLIVAATAISASCADRSNDEQSFEFVAPDGSSGDSDVDDQMPPRDAVSRDAGNQGDTERRIDSGSDLSDTDPDGGKGDSDLLEWRFNTGRSVESSPAVADGIVYVGSKDNFVYASDTP